MTISNPRITVMGEPLDWEELPDAIKPVEIADYFRPVKLSPRAIDQASKVVPAEHWISAGLHTWLSARANHVFSKLPTSKKLEAQLGRLKYFFEFDSDGPVLKTVSLV